MDNQPVATHRLERDKWRCDADGLHVITLERTGALVDKVPNHGEMQRSATLYRVGNMLHVRRTTDARIMMLHVLPDNRFRTQWERYQAD